MAKEIDLDTVKKLEELFTDFTNDLQLQRARQFGQSYEDTYISKKTTSQTAAAPESPSPDLAQSSPTSQPEDK